MKLTNTAGSNMIFAVLAATITIAFPVAVDGDTFKHGNERYRLWGIDAPEMSTAEGRVAATEFRYMIQSDTLTCEQKDVDNYGRNVVQCWNEEGEDIACAMVSMGLARDWSYFSNGYYKECE